ncbi:hypothetical protein UFOVP621_110 [uncultured Caudovirales phage]|uniref:Uncharacterized protein n=1 Tax=uncultured Caudovirales phage TaxID=2100421 RepID=A0A6J5N2L2_9CAUD|nr:hypothetical protein UFOVP621_110 [uncultured Caudovirales phage]
MDNRSGISVRCNHAEKRPNGETVRCPKQATHIVYTVNETGTEEGSLDASAGVHPTCKEHGQELQQNSNLAHLAGGQLQRNSTTVLAKDLSEIPRKFQRHIGSEIALQAMTHPANQLPSETESPAPGAQPLTAEEAAYEHAKKFSSELGEDESFFPTPAPSTGLEEIPKGESLKESDPVAHFNRLVSEQAKSRSAAGTEASIRSRARAAGEPDAPPIRQAGRPLPVDNAGQVSTTMYSLRKIQKGRGLEGTQEPGLRTERPNKSLTDIFPPSADAPAIPNQARLRGRVSPVDVTPEDSFITLEDEARAYQLNLLGAQRSDTNETEPEMVSALKSRELGKLVGEVPESGKSDESGLSAIKERAPKISTSKPYELAVKMHHTGHPMAWHDDKAVMVAAVPHYDDNGEHVKNRYGNPQYHWVPTTVVAKNKQGQPMSKDEVERSELYRAHQTAARKFTTSDRQGILDSAIEAARSQGQING